MPEESLGSLVEKAVACFCGHEELASKELRYDWVSESLHYVESQDIADTAQADAGYVADGRHCSREVIHLSKLTKGHKKLFWYLAGREKVPESGKDIGYILCCNILPGLECGTYIWAGGRNKV